MESLFFVPFPLKLLLWGKDFPASFPYSKTSTSPHTEVRNDFKSFVSLHLLLLFTQWYSINFRKLAFDGTLRDETDKWIGCIDMFITSCRRREVKIQRYCIGYMKCIVRNVWYYEWFVSTMVDIWLVLWAGSLLFCIEGVCHYFRLCCFLINLYVKTS